MIIVSIESKNETEDQYDVDISTLSMIKATQDEIETLASIIVGQQMFKTNNTILTPEQLEQYEVAVNKMIEAIKKARAKSILGDRRN